MIFLESLNQNHTYQGRETRKESRYDSFATNENINEETQLQVVDNMYYEGEIETYPETTRKNNIIPNLNDTETVTATHNVYYQM